MKRIVEEDSHEVLLDLILSEPLLFTEIKSKQGRYSPSDMPAPDVKQDKKTEILQAYRESLSSLPKMDDLALDLQTCEA